MDTGEINVSVMTNFVYATGSIKIKYIAPTPNEEIMLIAKIESYSEKKVLLKCDLISHKNKTVIADVWAFRVYDSSKAEANEFFKSLSGTTRARKKAHARSRNECGTN